jgi:hypothetical protein
MQRRSRRRPRGRGPIVLPPGGLHSRIARYDTYSARALLSQQNWGQAISDHVCCGHVIRSLDDFVRAAL